MNSRQEVFLSHSGLDHELANSLSRRIEHELNVRVFNTSDAADRLKDLKQILQPGMVWAIEAERHDTQLKDYLRENLLHSKAYLLLVTERSLEANSAWIKFEMQLASEEAKHRDLFFLPCVAGEELLGRLPRVAARFQGIAITSEDGFRKLLDIIKRALEKI